MLRFAGSVVITPAAELLLAGGGPSFYAAQPATCVTMPHVYHAVHVLACTGVCAVRESVAAALPQQGAPLFAFVCCLLLLLLASTQACKLQLSFATPRGYPAGRCTWQCGAVMKGAAKYSTSRVLPVTERGLERMREMSKKG